MSDIRVDYDKLFAFCCAVFEKLGVPHADALATAESLIAADLFGVESHGVARFERYVDGLRKGLIRANVQPKVVSDFGAMAAIDAQMGLGQIAGRVAMELAIKKAKEFGIAYVTVGNSSHYGVAGYYARMALAHDMIGVSATNANPLVVPTFGAEVIFGTNPIAIAAPAATHEPFVLDMATSTVPRGKIEVYGRAQEALHDGWAVDELGLPTHDAARVLANFVSRAGGGLTPLGGSEEATGGHKGYGLAVAIDILTGLLGGAAFGTQVGADKTRGDNVGHLFIAIDIARFMPLDTFKTRVDTYIEMLKTSKKAEGAHEIYIPGEQAARSNAEYRRIGIPLRAPVEAKLHEIGASLGIACDIAVG